MRKNSCGEPEHNCEACEDEWFGDERTNGTVIEHTCGKETLSKLTPENIKKVAKMANQDQRDLMEKALPSWEKDKIFKALYLLADEKVIDDVVDRLKGLIRQVIKTEREKAVKDYEYILKQKIGLLRQWLNEDRIDSLRKMVSSEQIEKWLIN